MEVSVVRTAVLDQAAVNRLVSLLAKLVAIRHLNNEARKRRQGGADTEKP